MASFHLIVLSVAATILIIMLAYMGSVMSSAKTNLVFPPVANVCPDNWTVSADGSMCSIGSAGVNVGALTATSAHINSSGSAPNVLLTLEPGNASWASSGLSSICGKSAWANANGVMWDGVSNYNSC